MANWLLLHLTSSHQFDYETSKGIAAEKLKKDDKLVIIGIPAPEKWRTPKGLELWKETLKHSDVNEKYAEIEKLNKKINN